MMSSSEPHKVLSNAERARRFRENRKRKEDQLLNEGPEQMLCDEELVELQKQKTKRLLDAKDRQKQRRDLKKSIALNEKTSIDTVVKPQPQYRLNYNAARKELRYQLKFENVPETEKEKEQRLHYNKNKRDKYS